MEENQGEINEIEEQDSGVLDRIVGIFASPRKTLQDINSKPTWAVPLLLYIATVIIITVVNSDIIRQDSLRVLESKNMPQEQMEKIQGMYDNSVLTYIQLIPQIIGIAALVLVLSSILFGISKMLKGSANFKTMFSVVSWSFLISAVGAYVKMILVAVKGTSYAVTPSLALALPLPEIGQKPSFLFNIFSNINPFLIWQLGIVAVGLSVINNFTTKKSLSIVLSLWVLWIIIGFVLQEIFVK